MTEKQAIKIIKEEKDWESDDRKIDAFIMAIEALKFKDYFNDLYGKGLEITNWHLNGELEPFDNFYESALEE